MSIYVPDSFSPTYTSMYVHDSLHIHNGCSNTCVQTYIYTLSACIIASSWQIIIGQEENWYYPKYLFYHCYERHMWIIQLIGKIVITTYRVLLLWNEISFFYKPVCIINTFIRSMEWAFETRAYVLWMSLFMPVICYRLQLPILN